VVRGADRKRGECRAVGRVRRAMFHYLLVSRRRVA
jgi:hypothetical protein